MVEKSWDILDLKIYIIILLIIKLDNNVHIIVKYWIKVIFSYYNLNMIIIV